MAITISTARDRTQIIGVSAWNDRDQGIGISDATDKTQSITIARDRGIPAIEPGVPIGLLLVFTYS